ncbi:MAG: hypothetical protein ACUVQQ_15275 [Thermogutta sp.]
MANDLPPLISRLLAGPEDTELNDRELAVLVAWLRRPVSLQTIQQEKKRYGVSHTLREREKLLTILRFNEQKPRRDASPAPGQNKAEGDAAQSPFVFCRDGDGWFVRGFGQEGHFKDRVGFQYIAKLLAAPAGAVAMMELVGGVEGGIRVTAGDKVLDATALKSYRERLAEIKAEIEEARRDNDLGALENLTREKQSILDELKSATGLGGKGRKLGDDLNRVRSRIANALERAFRALEKGGLKKLANHFRLTISAEGKTCVYRPDARPDWSLSGLVIN